VIEANLNWSPAEPAEIAQLLDEHHLVVVGDAPAEGWRFATQLGERLAALPGASVVAIDGRRIDDTASFCEQLAEALRVRCHGRGIDTAAELLRSPPGAPRHQFFLWRDAERLVASNPDLFGRLANAMLAIAAEKEHVSHDALVLQRSVFVGGDRLAAYADENDGPLRAWLLEDGATRFWEVISRVPYPPVLTYYL
jgi:hypothetical protein